MTSKFGAARPTDRHAARRGRSTASERPLWLFLTEPGLGPLLIKELKFTDVVAQKAQLAKLHLRNYDLLIAPDAVVRSHSAAPRLATHILVCPVFGRERVSEHQLDRLAQIAVRERTSELVKSIAGESLSKPEFERLVVRGLSERGVRLSAETDRAIWLLAVDEKYYFGFPRFNYHAAAGRGGLSQREGSLPPVIAAAIVFAAKPVPRGVIWDPVAGTGTLLAEAAVLAPQAKLIGTDIDPAALAMARKRLPALVHLIRTDATRAELEAGVLSLTIANLPFGKKFKSSGGNRSLYESVLRRSLAHASGEWRASLLTSDADALRQAVERIGGLVLHDVAHVAVRGLKASIWLITRQ
jgi:predicted RNA methylase